LENGICFAFRVFEQVSKKLIHGCVVAGNDLLRCNLVQGNKNKPTLGQSRVRNFKARFANPKTVHQQNIQIQRSRTIHAALRPVPSKFLLNRKQPIQQRVWSKSVSRATTALTKRGCSANPTGFVE
jgi:hypothetical protein